MRRSERAISRPEAEAILAAGEFGVLSTVGSDGIPYGIPISYCVIGDGIYVHCAVEGRKLDNLGACDQVSFCVIGNTEVLPDKFATRYESVIVSGRAAEVFDAEKQRAMEGLQEKYCSDYRKEGLEYIAKSWDRTRAFRIGIEKMTGKARR
ncbi:pyridoxamine 5'-phosphate oxidase family protein [Geomesophilobacter sediminis]|uniref:Pyridoxamine 5'-phosphate oxidase family protein n=1 Tax=Geomesophilobacter sediminis TaxID=2798584 RepID=A0A8J7LV53_9BACT|nr:pyridoxamine 5'-phosphate oxidase family protein [Geomesophilobacter sediminis]MBJ6724555.1 pyridoxamine 5'-phosphate oxidase family protein [Geomesophilobacter sediminis]